MVKVKTIKMPWKTKFFNEGQTVFVMFESGDQACWCRGKYRGKHNWINAWVKWNDKKHHLINIKEIEMSEQDRNNIMGNA